MSEKIALTAADGFKFTAWQSAPVGQEPKGCVLVIQEVFGVNGHIRDVCDRYAAEGYLALAPSLFDRVEPGVELGYTSDDMARGVKLARQLLKPEETLADLQASIDYLAQRGRVGVVGYCFGGLQAWLCAAKANNIACVSGYYGGGIHQAIERQPRVPTMLHFGDQDAHIPMSEVDAVIEAHPGVTVHVYAADHGFNCDRRGSYNEPAATLAKERTLAFFAEHLQVRDA